MGVIATARRSADEAAVPMSLDRIVPEGRFRHIEVGPLTVDALAELLRARLGSGFPRPTLVRLHQMSGGNPFFAIEIGQNPNQSFITGASEPFGVAVDAG